MPQLQRLACKHCLLFVDGVRAFQPVLQVNRTLRTLGLDHCYIGDEGFRLLADALVGNTTIEILDISGNLITSNRGLDDITRLLGLTRLKTILLGYNVYVLNDAASTQRFARVLSNHEFLKHLNLEAWACQLGDESIRILADALVGNSIMEVLDISQNFITSVGLPHITRLLVSMQLKTISIGLNRCVFNDEDATQHFVTTLQHKTSKVQELPGIIPLDFPVSKTATVVNSLTRNRQLNNDNLLLTPRPQQLQQQQQQQNHHGSAALMMLKTWHKAITTFAKAPNNAGASAIFMLFTACPQLLLEKRLKRLTTFETAADDAAVVSQALSAFVKKMQKHKRRMSCLRGSLIQSRLYFCTFLFILLC